MIRSLHITDLLYTSAPGYITFDSKPVMIPYADLARLWVNGGRSGEFLPWDERADFLEKECRHCTQCLRFVAVRSLIPYITCAFSEAGTPKVHVQ
jgi:hypothetical protein